MPTSYQHFQVERAGGITTVTLTSAELLDRLVTNELQDELINLVESEQPVKLIISFDGVRRCSTEMINALLRARKRVGEYQGQIRLCAMRSTIRDVFKMLNLDGKVFQIFDTKADASDGF